MNIEAQLLEFGFSVQVQQCRCETCEELIKQKIAAFLKTPFGEQVAEIGESPDPERN